MLSRCQDATDEQGFPKVLHTYFQWYAIVICRAIQFAQNICEPQRWFTRLLCAGNHSPKSWMGTVLKKRAGYRCFVLGSVVLREPAAHGNPRYRTYGRIACLAVRNEESGSKRALNDWCTVDLVDAIVPFGDRNCACEIHYLNMEDHGKFSNLHILFILLKASHFVHCRAALLV